jgi:nucleoside phosphorylase
VVITALAMGKYGNTSAASAAANMKRSFKAIQIGLMVGIAGGAPSSRHGIRLVDVVVSNPNRQRSGVFQYDWGKAVQEKKLEVMGSLDSPPDYLPKALTNLKAIHWSEGHGIKHIVEDMLSRKPRLRSEYEKARSINRHVLYDSSFIHADDDKSCTNSCAYDPDARIVDREPRAFEVNDPFIHFGVMASGNKLMMDAMMRDELVEQEGVLCIEMEAAGLMGHFPCLVIRGICDYSDTHKNDLWQGYAAAVAAAYAKELLLLALPARRLREEAAAPTTASAYPVDEYE